MPKLSQITHVDQNTKEKVNYFCDFFKHYAHLIGKNPDFPFENLLSITCRLEYQIKFNKFNRTKYVPYLAKQFKSYKGDIANSFPNYTIVYNELELYMSVTKHKNTWISNSSILNDVITILKDELDQKLFDKSLQELITALRCRHKLVTHKGLIKYITQTIVTELVFGNRTLKKVEKVISRIISKDKNEFPLSQNILCKNENDDYEDVLKEFFNNRTFKEQFEGIINYHRKPKTKVKFLFRIINLRMDRNDEFVYNNVTVISKLSKKLRALKKKSKEVFYLEEFFNSPNIVIAFTDVEYHEFGIGKEIAIRKIQNTLNFMNNSLIFSGSLDTYTCITTSDFSDIGGTKELTPTYLKLKDDYLSNLNKSNPYRILGESNAPCREQFLKFEHIYNSALIDDKIESYWHYLECIFLFGRDINAGHKIIIDEAAKILAHHFHKDYFLNYKLIIFNCLNGFMPNDSEFSFSYQESNEIWKDFRNSDIKEKTQRFKNTFVKDLNRALSFSKTRKFKLKSYDYFNSIFLELFETRNSYIHKGYLSPRTKVKMKIVIPPLMKIIRDKIMKKIKLSKRRDLGAVIKSLVKEY